MLQRALDKAKKGDDKKVSINFQTPSLMKEEFEKLCKENAISVTAMLNSLMEVAIEEQHGIEINDQSTFQLIEELDKAKQKWEQVKALMKEGETTLILSDGKEIELGMEEQIALAKISAITAELKKRGSQ